MRGMQKEGDTPQKVTHSRCDPLLFMGIFMVEFRRENCTKNYCGLLRNPFPFSVFLEKKKRVNILSCYRIWHLGVLTSLINDPLPGKKTHLA